MLETERLLMREFTLDDLEKLIEIRSEDEVIKYLGGRTMQNREALSQRIHVYISSYAKHGFGMNAIIWKESGEIIGWSGLLELDGTDEIEVGYGMIKEFWRRGIGFETANAWLNYGFNVAKLERIVAVASPENAIESRV